MLTPERLPDGDWARVCLDPRQYEALSRNIAEVTRWSKEARWQLDYYREALDADGAD